MAARTTVQTSRSAIVAGLRISWISMAWTLVVGACSIRIGVVHNSLVLVAFGLLGLFDAAGSAALIVHFRHALHSDTISARHERLALAFVTAGMTVVALGTAAAGIHRLATHAQTAERVPLGIALAAVSVLALAALARRKRQIASRIPSHALHADSWMSRFGAGLGFVTLTGTGLDSAFDWWWLDPGAAVGVAGGAVALSVVLKRRGPDDFPPSNEGLHGSR
jgi:divalent metal cation (Fe/Co/Zn/Cd) transporter